MGRAQLADTACRVAETARARALTLCSRRPISLFPPRTLPPPSRAARTQRTGCAQGGGAQQLGRARARLARAAVAARRAGGGRATTTTPRPPRPTTTSLARVRGRSLRQHAHGKGVGAALDVGGSTRTAAAATRSDAARGRRRHALPPHLSAGRDTPCVQCEWVAYTKPSERTIMRSTSSKEHASNPPLRPGRASGCWTARDRAKSGRCTNEQFPDVFSVEIVWTIKTGHRLDTV